MLNRIPGALDAAFEGLGDPTTSPWLADPRAGVRLHVESFRDGGSFLIPKSKWELFNEGNDVPPLWSSTEVWSPIPHPKKVGLGKAQRRPSASPGSRGSAWRCRTCVAPWPGAELLNSKSTPTTKGTWQIKIRGRGEVARLFRTR